MDSRPVKPKEQRQAQRESFLDDCTLQDVPRRLTSSPARPRPRRTRGMTRRKCVYVCGLGREREWRQQNVLPSRALCEQDRQHPHK